MMRIEEHRQAVEKKDMKNANAVRSEILNHCINWEESTVVEREEIMKQRRIKESIHIRRSRSYNLDEGYPLSQVWDIKDIHMNVHPSVNPLDFYRPMGNY